MIWKLAKFEFNYFRKQPSFYVTMLVFFLIPFFAMISDSVQIGGSANVNFNSPSAITQTILIMSIIGIFLIANFIGNVGVRDRLFQMDGMILSAPVPQSAYLWGRFLGGYAFCLLIFSMVPLGTFVGSFWPTVDAARLGPTNLMPYFWAFLIFVIPNFLFLSLISYVVSLKSKSMVGVYLAAVAFFILYQVGQGLFGDAAYRDIAAYLDPFGLSAYSDIVKYWTPHDLNHKIISLENKLLVNRLLWLAASLIIGVVVHFGFNLRAEKKLASKSQKKTNLKPARISYEKVDGSQSLAMDVKRFITRTKFEVSQIVKSAPFAILMLFSLFTLGTIFFVSKGPFGTIEWPLTSRMVSSIHGSFSLMTLIVMAYYSAETVWRERQLGIGDLIDATPVKNWLIYTPKIIGLSIVIFSLAILGTLTTVVLQTSKSFYNYEWLLYFGYLSMVFVLPSIMQTILAVLIQVLSPGKYIGMMIFVGYIILSIVLSQMGLEHKMWHFSDSPRLTYSDLNGYGHFLEATFWYNLFWGSIALIMAFVSYAIWPRGVEYALNNRLNNAKKNLNQKGIATVIVLVLIAIGSGSHIIYNTRVINKFVSKDAQNDLQENYEKKYKVHQFNPLPKITDVYAKVDIFPGERRVVSNGYYFIENKTDKPIDKFLMNWNSGDHVSFKFTMEEAKELEREEQYGTTWVSFEPPLQPGEKKKLQFSYEKKNLGYVDQKSDTRLVYNGTFLNNTEIFPTFGFNGSGMISDPHERRKRGLPKLDRNHKLEDESHYGDNMLSAGLAVSSDYVNFETIVSTSDDQKAIAPGYLKKEWVENGRRYFHYKMDAPILNFISYLSGKWELTEEKYKGVNIEIYHHPNHSFNIERMITAVKGSLDYLGTEFSPYQHRQARIIEFPRYSTFAQSFANTIPFSESIGFISDLRGEDAVDLVTFVTAHEMAHQWWAHQVIGANVQGSQVLSETLSEYSAYMIMEKLLGEHQLRQFLKIELDRYLSARKSELVEEMPLYRSENQQYIHYQKGGIVMYALKDRFGEQAVNAGLRKFITKYQYASDPYPTTLDLLSYLKAEIPKSGHEFVDDLFKKITIYDLRTKNVEVQNLEDGKFKVKFTLIAKKFYADGQGEEEEVQLNEQIDIGLFKVDPDKLKKSEDVIYLEKHSIKSGENIIEVIIDKEPEYGGFDPFIKLIDRNSSDNIKKVQKNN